MEYYAENELVMELDSDDGGMVFEDYFPSMMERMGNEGFMRELYNGFWLLMDVEKGVITSESLKRNTSLLLGLEEEDEQLRDEEIVSMLGVGDLDGDGALNHMEFCILMFRLSPALIKLHGYSI